MTLSACSDCCNFSFSSPPDTFSSSSYWFSSATFALFTSLISFSSATSSCGTIWSVTASFSSSSTIFAGLNILFSAFSLLFADFSLSSKWCYFFKILSRCLSPISLWSEMTRWKTAKISFRACVTIVSVQVEFSREMRRANVGTAVWPSYFIFICSCESPWPILAIIARKISFCVLKRFLQSSSSSSLAR